MRRSRIFVILIFLAVGCAAVPQKKAPLPPVTPFPSVHAAPSSIRAFAVITLNNGAPFSGRASIAAKAPASFRIEVFGPFGQTLALFVSDGSGVYVYANGAEAMYGAEQGAPPFSFRAADAASFFLGRAGEGFEITADAQGLVAAAVKYADGRPVFAARMEDYRVVDGIPVPFRVFIKNGETDVEIRYTSVEVNPDLPPDAFALPSALKASGAPGIPSDSSGK